MNFTPPDIVIDTKNIYTIDPSYLCFMKKEPGNNLEIPISHSFLRKKVCNALQNQSYASVFVTDILQ